MRKITYKGLNKNQCCVPVLHSRQNIQYCRRQSLSHPVNVPDFPIRALSVYRRAVHLIWMRSQSKGSQNNNKSTNLPGLRGNFRREKSVSDQQQTTVLQFETRWCYFCEISRRWGWTPRTSQTCEIIHGEIHIFWYWGAVARERNRMVSYFPHQRTTETGWTGNSERVTRGKLTGRRIPISCRSW